MDRLKEKLGPFPIWVWVVLGVGAIVAFWYLQKQGLLSSLGGGGSSGSSAAAPATGGATGLGGLGIGANPPMGSLAGAGGKVPPASGDVGQWFANHPNGVGGQFGNAHRGGAFATLPVLGSPDRGSSNWAGFGGSR